MDFFAAGFALRKVATAKFILRYCLNSLSFVVEPLYSLRIHLSKSLKQKLARRAIFVSMAERGGFEPPIRRKAYTAFRVRRIQPGSAISPLVRIFKKKRAFWFYPRLLFNGGDGGIRTLDEAINPIHP